MKDSQQKAQVRPAKARGKGTVLVPLLMLGTFTKSWRKREKLTQRQMAKRAGVALESIQHLEKGIGCTLTVESLFQIAATLDLHLKFVPITREPPKTPAEVLQSFDRLIGTKRARIFYQRLQDSEHKDLVWDIVGDPINNWLYVVVSNPSKGLRFGTMTTDPGGWSIASQAFGIDAETHAVAEELSTNLFNEHKAALLH